MNFICLSLSSAHITSSIVLLIIHFYIWISDSDEKEFEDDPLLQVLRKQRKWVKEQIDQVSFFFILHFNCKTSYNLGHNLMQIYCTNILTVTMNYSKIILYFVLQRSGHNIKGICR